VEQVVQAMEPVLELEELVDLAAQTEDTTPVGPTVAGPDRPHPTQAKVAAAPSVLFGPDQMSPLEHFHQQTREMCK
jgi:hypothetical protein